MDYKKLLAALICVVALVSAVYADQVTLKNGDTVSAGFARYDETPGASPSCRIWGHWNDELPGNPEGYSGSAGGNRHLGFVQFFVDGGVVLAGTDIGVGFGAQAFTDRQRWGIGVLIVAADHRGARCDFLA